MQTYEFKPTFIIDISDTFETKMKTVLAYNSQFFDPKSKSKEPETFVSQPKFLKYLEARARSYGFKIDREFGEAFYCEEEVEYDLVNLIKKG